MFLRRPINFKVAFVIEDRKVDEMLNPLHPNICMHILQTVLYTFPMEFSRRNYHKTIMCLLGVWPFPVFS